MIKLKRLQLLMTVIPLLLAMTLFSVGFAGWVSVAPAADETIGGTIHSYGVSDSSALVDLDNMTVFKYRAECFVNDDGESLDYGKINVTYIVNPANCAEEFGKDWNGSLKLYIVLRVINAGKADLFNTGNINNEAGYRYSISAKVQNTETPVQYDSTEHTLTIEYGFVNLDKTSTSVELQVEYTFSIPRCIYGTNTPANFRHCFGQYLKESEDPQERTKFVSSAWAEKS